MDYGILSCPLQYRVEYLYEQNDRVNVVYRCVTCTAHRGGGGASVLGLLVHWLAHWCGLSIGTEGLKGRWGY